MGSPGERPRATPGTVARGLVALVNGLRIHAEQQSTSFRSALGEYRRYARDHSGAAGELRTALGQKALALVLAGDDDSGGIAELAAMADSPQVFADATEMTSWSVGMGVDYLGDRARDLLRAAGDGRELPPVGSEFEQGLQLHRRLRNLSDEQREQQAYEEVLAVAPPLTGLARRAVNQEFTASAEAVQELPEANRRFLTETQVLHAVTFRRVRDAVMAELGDFEFAPGVRLPETAFLVAVRHLMQLTGHGDTFLSQDDRSTE